MKMTVTRKHGVRCITEQPSENNMVNNKINKNRNRK